MKVEFTMAIGLRVEEEGSELTGRGQMDWFLLSGPDMVEAAGIT